MATRRSGLISGLVVLGMMLAGCGLGGALMQSSSLSKTLEERGYTDSSVNVGFNTSNGVRTDTLTVTVDRPQDAATDDRVAGAVASTVMEAYPGIAEIEVLVVILRSDNGDRQFSRSPEQWRDLVAAQNQPPGIVDAVTARASFGEEYEPRDVKSEFSADQPIIHTIVSVRNLPAGSVVKAVWTAVETRGQTAPNSVMISTEARVEGTRNVDFTLEPNAGRLPPGSYKVDIYLGENLERTLLFTVAGG